MKRLLLKSLLYQAIIYLFCFPFYQVQAQKNPYNEVSIASPTAASLGKYADIPVNNHTGIPQIGIPIYTVKEGPLELPINLSYHASGLKVMEPASWVGSGWALNAGGVITRTVQGAPDERMTSNSTSQDKGHYSDFGYNSYLYEGINPQTNKPSANWQPFAEGRRDGEPDLFFFNFAGYSGKFYFRDDRTPVLVPEQDLKIECSYPNSGSIASFIITDPNGVKYHFGKRGGANEPVEITNPYTAQSGLTSGTAISSWYLNKIVSADDVFTIQLNYQAENYSYYTISMFPVRSDLQPVFSNPDTYEYRLVKNIVNGVRLSSITCSNGSINFLPGSLRQDLGDNTNQDLNSDFVTDEAKSLGAIEITNAGGSFCKRYVFSYSYFTDNSSSLTGYLSNYNALISTDRKRLKLDSIQEQTCNGLQKIPTHIFEYFTEAVPRRLSFAQDHWGFYNGAVSNTSLIPTYTINNVTTVNGANRDASWPAMRGGALKKITYPTGGFTEFTFQAHSTPVIYSSVEWNTKVSLFLGYGSSASSVSGTLNASGNTIKVEMSNNLNGPNATIEIKSGTNTLFIRTLSNNTSLNETISLAAGTYQVILTKGTGTFSGGTNALVSELTPVTINQEATVGGLRIDSITSRDGITTQTQVTHFYYPSSGVLYSRPAYVQIIRNNIIKNEGYFTIGQNGYYYDQSCSPNGCIACDGSSQLPYFKSPSPIRPMETTQGNHIGYNEVKVSKTGNGYSVFRYYGSNIWDLNHDDVAYRNVSPGTCDPNIPNYPAAPLPTEFLRGELKYEGHFDENGQLLKEVDYVPVYENSPAINTPAFMVTSVQNGSVTQYLGTIYQLTTARKIKTTTVKREYMNSSLVVTSTDTTYFDSPWHRQATITVGLSSKGEKLETRYQYAADFRIAAVDAIADCSSALTNAQNACLTQYNSVRSNCSGASAPTCLANAYLDYQYCLTQARVNFVNCRQSYATSINSAWQSAKSSASSELKPIMELRDQNDFSPIEVSEWTGGKLLKASFNRFDYVSNPVGKVYLNKTQLLNLTAPSATFTAASVSGSTILKDSRYKDEDLLKFNAGKLVELTKKDGIVTTYIWGYNSDYPVAKVSGASFNNVSAILASSILQNPSSDQALRDELNKIRLQFPAALVNTYSYLRLVGITSATDPRGQINYYEYDSFGRLLHVRDDMNNIIKRYNYNYQVQ